MQSFAHRLLQYAGDQDDMMYSNDDDNDSNVMERLNDTSSFRDANDAEPIDNRLDGLSNLTDDNVMSWFENTTDILFDNSTNTTTNPSLAGGMFSSSSHGDGSNDNCNGTFDPTVFWCVNAFILVLFVATILCCCYGKKEWMFQNAEERRRASDEAYRQSVLERQRRQQEATLETPAQRTKNLLESFALNKVQMVRTGREIGFDRRSNLLVSPRLGSSLVSQQTLFTYVDGQGGRFDRGGSVPHARRRRHHDE